MCRRSRSALSPVVRVLVTIVVASVYFQTTAASGTNRTHMAMSKLSSVHRTGRLWASLDCLWFVAVLWVFVVVCILVVVVCLWVVIVALKLSSDARRQHTRVQRRQQQQQQQQGLSDQSRTTQQPMAAHIDGDIVLGGLFPVHSKDSAGGCDDVQKDRGIQRLEAMLFAVDHINRDRSLLPGIVLGAHVLDTCSHETDHPASQHAARETTHILDICSHETYALDQSLEYVRASLNVFDPAMFRCDDRSTPDIVSQPDPVVGVVGGSYSSVSTQVSLRAPPPAVLHLFHQNHGFQNLFL